MSSFFDFAEQSFWLFAVICLFLLFFTLYKIKPLSNYLAESFTAGDPPRPPPLIYVYSRGTNGLQNPMKLDSSPLLLFTYIAAGYII